MTYDPERKCSAEKSAHLDCSGKDLCPRKAHQRKGRGRLFSIADAAVSGKREREPMNLKIIRSNRKTISMRIIGPDSVEVRAPQSMPQSQIDAFIKRHHAWLEKHLARSTPSDPPFTEDEIRSLAEKALVVIPERVRHYAALIGVSYFRITIRNQKSKWGSCSAQGNLNFNCLLMLCPRPVLDYGDPLG